MEKENLKLIIDDIMDGLKNAKLPEDGSIRVTIKYGYVEGTINYGDFRCFCDDLIRKLRMV